LTGFVHQSAQTVLENFGRARTQQEGAHEELEPGAHPELAGAHRIAPMPRSTFTSADTLEQVPLLEELSKRDRQNLAKSMKERTFKSGQQIVVEGRTGVGFFIILEGKAAVTIGGELVQMLGPGDYFGEMALLDGGARTATITSDGELRCATMTSWSFKSFVLDNPKVAWAMLQTLAQRLRASRL
jgi:CRP/FNR family transcriptional regulator, cyclic AMP receptor protein